MEIRQLKYFISVAETRSFSEASRQCFLSQSAISQQIKLLEEEVGTPLFLRNTHSVKLTEAGSELLPLARQALKSIETCKDHMASIQGLMVGTLSIGVSHSMESYICHAAIEMLRRYPEMKINLVFKNGNDLRRMLLSHEVDLAFSINPSDENDGVDSQPICSYELYAAMNHNHPLASKQMLTFRDLIGPSIILPERSNTSIHLFCDILQVDFSKLNVRANSDNPCSILDMLQESQFISFLPCHTVASRPSLVSRPIKEFAKPITCYEHHLHDVCQKQCAKVMIEILTKETIPYLTACRNAE